jgi:transcriptional regulator
MRVLLTIFLPMIRLSHGKRKNDFDVYIKDDGDISVDMADIVVRTQNE